MGLGVAPARRRVAAVSFWRRVFEPRRDGRAQALYAALVKQARQPEFYLGCGVPDTVDGRFEMIALHAFLLLRRLKRDRQQTADLAQAVFDLMFTDMDENLREMGTGDQGVGKRVKAMATALYGRIKAYENGLAGGGLDQAIRRNLFGTATPKATEVARLARYLRREAAALDAAGLDQLLAGQVTFGPAPASTTAEETA